MAKSMDTLLLVSRKKVAQMREDIFSLEQRLLSLVREFVQKPKTVREELEGIMAVGGGREEQNPKARGEDGVWKLPWQLLELKECVSN